MENEKNSSEKIYPQRLDFYYQTIAIYLIVLILYSILRGTIEGGVITIRLFDPISILLALFIIGTAISLLFDSIKRRTIIIGSDYIIFRVGKKEKKYYFKDIERIAIKADRTFRFRSNYRNALIKLPGRKRLLRLRFSSYHNDKELCEEIIKIKKIIDNK